jgi:exodeoxyribonuclease V alpha subunit
MNPYFDTLSQTGLFSEIDLHFTKFISDISQNDDPDILLCAALVSRVTVNGDVCLDLEAYADKVLNQNKTGQEMQDGTSISAPELSMWIDKLIKVKSVGKPGEFCPLVLDGSRLYLYRYWEYEKKLIDAIRHRVEKKDFKIPDIQHAQKVLSRLFPEPVQGKTNRQKIAALVGFFKRFSVISGGPGTGKTYAIARILAFLCELSDANLRIFLCAPTGKAAARLSESIRQAKQMIDCSDHVRAAIPDEAFTVHRMLNTITGTPYFRYHSENQLPADVVVVDETSMVDIALMSKLVQALSVDARIILAGDSGQLSSVEAGSVMGDVCHTGQPVFFSKAFCDDLEKISGEDLAALAIGHKIKGSDKHNQMLSDCIVTLKERFRFEDTGYIGELSCLINAGEVNKVVSLLKCQDDVFLNTVCTPDDFFKDIETRIIRIFSECIKAKTPEEALERLNTFKILCAVRKGPFGSDTINRMAEKMLMEKKLITHKQSYHDQWYKGKPVLITKNDYKRDLFNGDIGIILSDPESGSNELYAFFQGPHGTTRRFFPGRLPEHETVFAMSVHKSQGSEFDEVLLVLPDKDYPVLTRELMYTGVTRAKKKVSIWGQEHILKTALSRTIARTSGLSDALWPSHGGFCKKFC